MTHEKEGNLQTMFSRIFTNYVALCIYLLFDKKEESFELFLFCFSRHEREFEIPCGS